MGIPSYFSHIVKNHREILKKLYKLKKNIDNLYLDSNSIIYDELRVVTKEITKEISNELFEKKLIENVCKKLEYYINELRPNKRVFIAFDGVAPVAKLDQQRNRRYKSALEKKLFETKTPWDRCAITPGTEFMRKLTFGIKNYFNRKEKKFGVRKIIISGPDDPGEGEHKLFNYIRENSKKHKKEVTIIYGLDADLIMLCLNHLYISKNIYLFRETPEFIKSINSDLNPNENYILDIPLLSQIIIEKMNNGKSPNNKQQVNRLFDYILMCFFLGNDFMPHFPSINIRTNGIHKMMSAYNNTIGRTDENLTDGNKLYWKNIYKLVKDLEKNELHNIKEEYKLRDRLEKRKFGYKTEEEKMNRYQNIPIKNREKEKYIDPYNYGWQKRYYEVLFKSDNSEEFKKEICMNFLEGLEWVMKYYTKGCIDWNWTYKYNYPPLLEDLIKYIPEWECVMLEEKEKNPISSDLQLSYVLPKSSLNLIPNGNYEKLKDLNFYDDNCEISWSFCKYLWESHVELPHIDLNKLNEILCN